MVTVSRPPLSSGKFSVEDKDNVSEELHKSSSQSPTRSMRDYSNELKLKIFDPTTVSWPVNIIRPLYLTHINTCSDPQQCRLINVAKFLYNRHVKVFSSVVKGLS